MSRKKHEDQLPYWKNPQPICPHCDKALDELYDFTMRDGEIEVAECYYCDREFEIEFEVKVSYTTRKLEGDKER